MSGFEILIPHSALLWYKTRFKLPKASRFNIPLFYLIFAIPINFKFGVCDVIQQTSLLYTKTSQQLSFMKISGHLITSKSSETQKRTTSPITLFVVRYVLQIDCRLERVITWVAPQKKIERTRTDNMGLYPSFEISHNLTAESFFRSWVLQSDRTSFG